MKQVRDRIDSVKNTKKITEAMKLVAAAKVRKAQDAVVQGRPFAENLIKARIPTKVLISPRRRAVEILLCGCSGRVVSQPLQICVSDWIASRGWLPSAAPCSQDTSCASRVLIRLTLASRHSIESQHEPGRQVPLLQC